MKRRVAKREVRGGRREATPRTPVEDCEIAVLDGPMPEAARQFVGTRVELDAAIGGWSAHGRLDVVLRGQIISTAPAESLAIIEPGGRELLTIAFGQRDHPEPVALPGGVVAFQTGFQAYLPMPGEGETRIADLSVREVKRLKIVESSQCT